MIEQNQHRSNIQKPLSVTLASFWLRLIAWVYDLLGAIAIFILALLIGYILIYFVTLPWASKAEELSMTLSHNPLWFIYLALSVQYYYVWCWVKGGQTVGMRTWRLKLCKQDGNLLTWKEAYIRSFLSFAGFAQIWSLVDKEKRGWHDIMSGSVVVVLPKGHDRETKPLI